MIGRFLRYLIPLAALGYALMLGFSALFGEGALMIGAIVLGQDPTPEELREITAAYRAAVDAL